MSPLPSHVAQMGLVLGGAVAYYLREVMPIDVLKLGLSMVQIIASSRCAESF